MLIRLGGLVAMACGVLFAAQGLTVWLSEPPFSLSIPYLDRASDLTWQTLVNVSDVVFLVGALLAVAALATLYILRRGVNGIAGALVSLVALVGLAILIVLGLGDVFQWSESWSSTPLIWGSLLATLGDVSRNSDRSIASVTRVGWGCANSGRPEPGTRGARWRAFRGASGGGLGDGRVRHLSSGGTPDRAPFKSALR